jgi:uncharacterized membrane protein
MTRVVDFFRDPLRTLLLLGTLTGVFVAFAVPHFGGIDETAHFYRSYQLSTGTLLPEKPAHSSFSGACVPVDVVLAVDRDALSYYQHVLTLQGEHPGAAKPPTAADVARCPHDHTQGFVTFSTFGSPVPYLPQATAILVARAAGADVGGMLVLARLALLATFLALVAVAVRRTPRGKWAFAAVGLLPVALFQASASLSHDAVTLGVSLVVVSSALRALDPPDRTSTRALVIEACALSALLGLCKPGYVVVAFAYVLPLLRRRGERDRALRWLAVAPVAAMLLTVVWNAIVGGLWKTDASYFGVKVDPGRQQHLLLTQPWKFAWAAVATTFDSAWEWVRTYTAVGPSVTHWPSVVGVVAALVLLLVAFQSRREPARLVVRQRLLLLVLLVLVVLLTLGAQYVYWSAPGAARVGGMQARFFLPGLVLLPLAVGPIRARWADSDAATLPLSLLLVPVLAVFCASLVLRMH